MSDDSGILFFGAGRGMPAFISHKSEDAAIYSAICLALDGRGVQRWDPNKMSRGEALADQLRDAIRTCEVCVFIATSRSITSSWCLAELGAFWGAGKRVLLFLAEPNLADSVLPPQFKGDLKVLDAYELIDAVEDAIDHAASAEAKLDPEFKGTSGNYGKERDWQSLLHETNKCFDIMGVVLGEWRKTPSFRETILEKADKNCSVRILLMHEDNNILPHLLYDTLTHSFVVSDIKQSYEFYSAIAKNHTNIEVRKIISGIPHFFLTRTDQHAVIIQYLSSGTWGSGPTWRCAAQSHLYNVAVKEFECLWTKGVGAPAEITGDDRKRSSQSDSASPE